MANTKGTKKRIRQIAKRTAVNKAKVSRFKTFVRKVEDFIKAGNKDEAAKAFTNAQSLIAKTAKSGIIHKNTASRKISRLSAKIKTLA